QHSSWSLPDGSRKERIQAHPPDRNHCQRAGQSGTEFQARPRLCFSGNHGYGQCGEHEHNGRHGEHGHRQPLRRKHAAERPQLQLTARPHSRCRVDSSQWEFGRNGPVQRKRSAPRCELLHSGWCQRQPRDQQHRAWARRSGSTSSHQRFGGMSNLASIDALQEFRVQTSTFAPEFGRTPGAQVSVVTKSGTNALHGTAFEYFRNDILDANDWFANNAGKKKAALRQNDFGGTLGGPIIKNKLFFFGSYEGLRVRLPKVANTYEPTLATVQSAPAAVQPLLNAFPKPNGAPCPNCGPGTAGFSATYSDPSSLDSGSGRIDYLMNNKVTIFGRYSDAPSDTVQRAGAQSNYNALYHTDYTIRTLTIGSTQMPSSRLI